MIADLKPSHPDMLFKIRRWPHHSFPAAISDLAVSEFGHIQDWSSANRLSISLSKTKEMIIFRPGSRAKHTAPREFTGIGQVHTAKLLGVCFSDNLSFAAHIDDTLSAVSQRFYLLKQLKIRCLNQVALYIVFQSLGLNKITYAVQSYSGYLQEQQIDRLQAMLNKAKKWGLVLVLYNSVKFCKIKTTGFSTK